MIVVYTKANCPQCVKVKNELTLRAVDFTEIRVDLKPESREFLIREGHKSVPQIYQDDKHVKDYTTLSNEINE